MGYKNKNTFQIELTSPGGNAILTFKKPLVNAILDSLAHLGDEKNTERLKTEFTQNMAYLVDVEGLENEDGTEITVEQIKALEVDFQLLRAINVGFNSHIFKVENDPEKKIQRTSSYTR